MNTKGSKNSILKTSLAFLGPAPCNTSYKRPQRVRTHMSALEIQIDKQVYIISEIEKKKENMYI